jgi:hypothetical protein
VSNILHTMEIDSAATDVGRAPGARELLPILPIAAAVAWIARAFVASPWVSTTTALMIALAGAGLIGLPALFWTLDHGRRRIVPILLVGAVAGAAPLVLIVLSAVMGLTVRHGVDMVRGVLATGVPFPLVGVMRWPTFARAELQAVLIGVATGAIHWALFLSAHARGRNRRDPASRTP